MPKRMTNKYIDEMLDGKFIRLEDWENSRVTTIKLQCCKNPKHIFDANVTHYVTRGWGCPVCKGINKWTNEIVDAELAKRNIDIERISNVVNGHTKCTWKCKKNSSHIFENTPCNFFHRGGKCPHCAKRVKWDENKLRNMLKKNNPTIILKNFNSGIYQCTICKYEWKLKNNKDIGYGRSGCPKCANVANLTNEEVDKRLLERDAPTIRIGEYKNLYSKILWRCKDCGVEWAAKPRNVIHQEQDCPNCHRHILSYIEIYVGKILSYYFNSVKCHHQLRNIEPIKNENGNIIRRWIEVDYMFEYNKHIYFLEYNGRQHYHPIKYKHHKNSGTTATKIFKEQVIRDKWLRKYCKENNIILIEIDGRKYNKKSIVKEHVLKICKKILAK